MKSQEIKQLGPRIREHRKKRGLTLVELSQKIGLTPSYLSRIERGVTSPSLESLILIAFAFQVKIAELFGEFREHPPDRTGR